MFCIFLVTAAAAAAGGRQHQVKHGPSGSYTAPPDGKRSKLDAELVSFVTHCHDMADCYVICYC
jgi:hypothetical protein